MNLQGVFDEVEEVWDLGFRWEFVDGSEGFRSPTSFVNLKGVFDGVEEVGDLGFRWEFVAGSEGFRSPTSFVNLKGVFDGVEEVGDLGRKAQKSKEEALTSAEGRKERNSGDNNPKTDIVAATNRLAPEAIR